MNAFGVGRANGWSDTLLRHAAYLPYLFSLFPRGIILLSRLVGLFQTILIFDHFVQLNLGQDRIHDTSTLRQHPLSEGWKLTTKLRGRGTTCPPTMRRPDCRLISSTAELFDSPGCHRYLVCCRINYDKTRVNDLSPNIIHYGFLVQDKWHSAQVW